jgi:hypothetical protein
VDVSMIIVIKLKHIKNNGIFNHRHQIHYETQFHYI